MEALPIGTARIRTRTTRKQLRRERFVKVSHHGSMTQRWRPFARHWWEQNIGTIPAGHNVFHRDGDTLNDDPTNFVLCHSDRFRLIFALRPEAQRNQRRRRASAVARSNRRRAEIHEALLNPAAWYVVLPLSKAIVWQPCRTQLAARRLIETDRLAAMCQQDIVRLEKIQGVQYQPGHPVKVVQGDRLNRGSWDDGEFEGFIRLIPDVRRAPVKRGAKTPPPDFVSSPSAG